MRTGPGTGERRQFDAEDVLERLDKRKVRNAGFKLVRVHVMLSEQALSALDRRRSYFTGGRGVSRGAFIEWLVMKGKDVRRAQLAWSERGHEEDTYDGE
jgi:hypothetical protein